MLHPLLRLLLRRGVREEVLPQDEEHVQERLLL
jgi:hypothetical protein